MSEVFSDGQTRYILENIGVSVVSETPTHWLCLCPFHANFNTPAMVVDKYRGVYLCNNAACDARGTIRDMIQRQTGKSFVQTEFLIIKARNGAKLDIEAFVKRELEPVTFPDYPVHRLEAEENAFWNDKDAQDYMMKTRGFEERTLLEFRVGYVPKYDIVTVPMFDQDGSPIGFVGRGVHDKVFKNSKRLPKRFTLFNIHNAKKNERTVLVEASFDVMSIWQATGTHAVATLGSSLGEGQIEQLNRFFTHVILAPDDDWQTLDFKPNCRRCRERGEEKCVGHNTGRELGLKVVEGVKGVRTSWAHLDSLKQYDGAKDPGELTPEQIQYALNHPVSSFEMVRRMA